MGPGSNELAVQAVWAHPDRFAIMGRFYLDQPENRALVERSKEDPRMLGLRFYVDEQHKESWVTDGTLDWLWPAAERTGVPVSLAAAMFLPTVGKIAERHPGLKLSVDRMIVPRAGRGESAYRFQSELLALAKYPNVAVKATRRAGYAEEEYPFRSLHPHLQRCFDAFGPERMFWGTDITRMQCSWRQCVTLFTEQLPWLKVAISSQSPARLSAIGWVGPACTSQSATSGSTGYHPRRPIAQIASNGNPAYPS